MPEVEVPRGYTPGGYLRKLAYEGLNKNYGGKPTYEKARSIQETELEVISKLGYSSYFLIVLDIRTWANDRLRTGFRKPTDCTILRGSAANSITFYNIGASDLDPIRYDLYFQRFLNEDRASPPDADLDFGWDERDDVLEYVTKRWGEDRVAMTCTFQHYRRKAAFRETAKVFGYSDEQISKIVKSGWNPKYFDEDIQKIQHLANKIVGKPHFLGQHPGGMLITNDPICRHVGLERSGGEKDRVITQIDMHSGIDELGLIKFDLLGNGSLSVLRDALTQVEEQGLSDPHVSNLDMCYADPKTIEVITKGRTRGVFYIESPAQSRLNKKAGVETFEELAITSSLVRPAGSAYCNDFVDRHRMWKKGVVDWEYIHPSLEPILKDTHGILAFQEDVTKVCHTVAGLTYKQADKIRKMMNSLHEGAVEDSEWRLVSEQFIQGSINTSGLDRTQAIELWKMVSSFTGFSFCKSHSGSYAQLSFQCAYMKAHYPAQFLSAVISNNHGFYSRDTYLNEARRWGVRILPIDVNESKIKYFGKHDWIRPGIMHTKGLTEASKAAVVEARNSGGRFRNLDDFLQRVRIGRRDVEKLILVGAFDGFGMSQPELLYRLEGQYGKHRGRLNFRDEGARLNLDDYTLTERCLNELDLLGFMLSGNILDILELHPGAKNAVPAKALEENVGKGIQIFGWPVTQRGHTTSRNEPMSFVTIEDKTGAVDVIFWPRNYARFKETLRTPGPFQIWGRVTEDWGTYCLEAENVKPVDWSPAEVDFQLAEEKLSKSFKDYRYHDLSITAA
jgi:DNA polymerase-3 subunit alpha/error-prone DNA polymerase